MHSAWRSAAFYTGWFGVFRSLAGPVSGFFPLCFGGRARHVMYIGGMGSIDSRARCAASWQPSCIWPRLRESVYIRDYIFMARSRRLFIFVYRFLFLFLDYERSGFWVWSVAIERRWHSERALFCDA
ncbi:hypothetical protein P171DRAFT_129611 [Karstenula rhodostoma CBS 690.94]|uniref:Uncharacterized protein n=1 Tax=Karstenula rhodostoma CBS 690.94 TaxID=1392251 RepID=A0A9P4P9H8_9PLEO|nr:hypothetical protein P171DRAFT_129611 [Karstenula rhodostoma CBS 690.94]